MKLEKKESRDPKVITHFNQTAETQAAASQSVPADFEALFQQRWPKICAVLYRLTGDWDEAEDLALETFVQLYRRPPARGEQLGGWLYRVATHLGLNALRARKRRAAYEAQASSFAQEDTPPDDPAALMEQAQERRQVRQALAEMNPRAAQLLLLRHAGFSYAELARALELAPGSVGTLLGRAEKEFEHQFQKLKGG